MKRLSAMTFALLASIGLSSAAAQSGNHLEVIHHLNYDKSLFMPFSPALKVKSGKLLWLAGGTAHDGRDHADPAGRRRVAQGRGAHLHLPHAPAHGRYRPLERRSASPSS